MSISIPSFPEKKSNFKFPDLSQIKLYIWQFRDMLIETKIVQPLGKKISDYSSLSDKQKQTLRRQIIKKYNHHSSHHNTLSAFRSVKPEDQFDLYELLLDLQKHEQFSFKDNSYTIFEKNPLLETFAYHKINRSEAGSPSLGFLPNEPNLLKIFEEILIERKIFLNLLKNNPNAKKIFFELINKEYEEVQNEAIKTPSFNYLQAFLPFINSVISTLSREELDNLTINQLPMGMQTISCSELTEDQKNQCREIICEAFGEEYLDEFNLLLNSDNAELNIYEINGTILSFESLLDCGNNIYLSDWTASKNQILKERNIRRIGSCVTYSTLEKKLSEGSIIVFASDMDGLFLNLLEKENYVISNFVIDNKKILFFVESIPSNDSYTSKSKIQEELIKSNDYPTLCNPSITDINQQFKYNMCITRRFIKDNKIHLVFEKQKSESVFQTVTTTVEREFTNHKYLTPYTPETSTP